jgi:predicted phage terminase large subunit-like protein
LAVELDAAIAPHVGQRFYWCSVPVRHWKTFTLRHAIAAHLETWPEEEVAYVTHTQKFANKNSRAIRKLADRGGLALSRETNRQDEWELEQGGGLVARGIGGEVTGRGFRLIVIDDPFRRAADAESPARREEIYRSIDEDILTRLTPDGCAFLIHARWHPDDAIGRFSKREEWRGTNIKALSGEAEDQPLLPDVWGFEYLDRIRRANVYKFASLYQGEPRPRGGALFGEPHFYDPSELPKVGYRVGYGIDLAYTAKTSADWSVLFKIIAHGGKFYVTHFERRQGEVPDFLELLVRETKEPGPIWWYPSGTEKGGEQFIRKKIGSRFKTRPASSDKYTRAQPVAEAWNLGNVLLPGGDNPPAWVDDCVRVICHFTGKNDPQDDEVDALAAAYDSLTRRANPMAEALLKMASAKQ